MKTDSLF